MSLYDASLPAPDPYSEAYAVQPNNGETGEPAAAAPEAPQDAEGPRRDRSRSRSPGARRGSRSRSPGTRRRSPVPPKRPAHAPVNPNPSSVLGVFGLSIRTQERDLEEEFSRYGTVEKVTIVYDQRSDRSRGFGFIRMATPEDAGRCIERLNGVDLNGRRIRVDYSVTDRPHQPTPGEYMGHRRRDDDRYRGSGSDYRGSGGGGGGGGGSRSYDRDRDRSRRDDFGRDSERRDGWRDRRSPRRYSRSPRRRSYSRSPERRDRDRDRDRSDRDRSDRDHDHRGDRDRDRGRDRSDRDRESRW